MKLVFFDLETSGLDVQKHEIIQIAAMATTETFQIVDAYERKLWFDEDAADPEALAINHYSPSEWQLQALTQREGLTDFNKFLRTYASIQKTSKGGKPYWVAQLAGYNVVKFDAPMLQRACGLVGVFLSADYRVLDVMQLAQWWAFYEHGYRERLTLSAVAEMLDIEAPNAHDAAADVRTTIEVAKRLTELLRGDVLR